MTTEKITSVAALAAAIGTLGDGIDSVSKAIYKGTACGAWVDAREVGVTRKRRFKVVFGESIWGLVAHQWQEGGRGTWRSPSELITPRRLVEYLGGPEPKFVGPKTQEVMLLLDTEEKTLAGLRQRTKDTDRQSIEWLPRKKEVAWITLDVTTGKPGIGVGSIVEGVDQCTAVHELAFPFTMKKFWKAVAAVDEEAQQIWNDTHGCDDCPEDPETGYHIIDPKCPTCKGEGQIL